MEIRSTESNYCAADNKSRQNENIHLHHMEWKPPSCTSCSSPIVLKGRAASPHSTHTSNKHARVQPCTLLIRSRQMQNWMTLWSKQNFYFCTNILPCTESWFWAESLTAVWCNPDFSGSGKPLWQSHPGLVRWNVHHSHHRCHWRRWERKVAVWCHSSARRSSGHCPPPPW